MSLTITIPWNTGATLALTRQRRSDSFYWNPVAQAFQNAPAYADKKLSFIEGSGDEAGCYTATDANFPLSTLLTGGWIDRVHDEDNGNEVIASGENVVEAAIYADTDELQTDWANGGRLDAILDVIQGKTDNLPASPAATGDQMTLADAAITADKIATDAITAAKVAADVTTELQDGLATSSEVGAVESKIDTVQERTGNLPDSPAATGDAMALVDSALTAAKIATDAITADKVAADVGTEIRTGLATSDALTATQSDITSIKAKSDQMVFTVSNRLDVQIIGIQNNVITTDSINDAALTSAKIADNAITAAKIATDAIDADAVAADAFGSLEIGETAIQEIGAEVAAELLEFFSVNTLTDPVADDGGPPSGEFTRDDFMKWVYAAHVYSSKATSNRRHWYNGLGQRIASAVMSKVLGVFSQGKMGEPDEE